MNNKRVSVSDFTKAIRELTSITSSKGAESNKDVVPALRKCARLGVALIKQGSLRYPYGKEEYVRKELVKTYKQASRIPRQPSSISVSQLRRDISVFSLLISMI